MSQLFYSHGKLLLTSEYAVLDGALSLAVPTRLGQALIFQAQKSSSLSWESRDHTGRIWFEATFPLEEIIPTGETGLGDGTRNRLLQILKVARQLNPGFLDGREGGAIETRLEFPMDWGLGSSSSLISNLARLAGVDAYELQARTFGGSGYDIACAESPGPILFQRKKGSGPSIQQVDFSPPFRDNLYLVHLNRKQDSRKGIQAYRDRSTNRDTLVTALTGLTQNILSAQNLEAFNEYLEAHEQLVADCLGLPSVRQEKFSDFPGGLKSLGAWGGDFILATGGPETPGYFRRKGYPTVQTYGEIVL